MNTELFDLLNINKRVLANKWRSIDNQKLNAKKRYQKYKDRLIKANIIKKQYSQCLKCWICSEARVIELAHIVPLAKGGSSDIHNLAALCPTHHTLLDRNKLNEKEMEAIKDRIELAEKYHSLNANN